MYSNDMWEFHPEKPEFWGQHPLQFWENGKVKIERVTASHQKMLTKWYTEHAVDFIQRHKDKPFFLYVPHSMPHVPLFCSPAFEGKSGAGLYGDVMMEIDWSVGQINQALNETGIADNTLVMLSSDNGPWISYGNHAGKTPFREAKGTSFDGGTRSACIIKLPGRIKPGTVSDKAFCSIDILPTLASLAEAKLPDNPVDGKNVWDLIVDKAGAANPHEYYPFSTGRTFDGIISGDGRWKLHLPHSYRTLVKAGKDGKPGEYETKKIALSLFDMKQDPYETTNLVDRRPELAARLKALAEAHRKRFYGKKEAKLKIPPASHPDTRAWNDLFKPDLSNAEKPKGVWTYRRGVLTARKDKAIWTKKDYDNFILDLEFKTAEGSNSGVIVYCSDMGKWIPNSVEVQIADDYADKWARSPKSWQCGAIFGHLGPSQRAVKKPGQWNRFTITCKDHMIYVMLNGALVTTMDMRKWTSAKTNPDGSTIPPWLSRPVAELPTRGRIGLQGKHAGAPIWFRALKIKEIK
jgi:hypothetical protein